MRLKSGERVIADKFNSVSILFADIVNFTQLSQSISAVELVELLNEIFSTIDDLTIKYNLEKIKTIGDCYMVISGAPIPNKDHAIQMAFFALELQSVITQLTLGRAFPILFRIGIHSGDCLLYTSDAADERSSVDLGGRRIIKKKNKKEKRKKKKINTNT